MRKSAGKILAHEEALRKTARTVEEVNEIDVLVKELRTIEAGFAKRAMRTARTAKKGDIHKSFFANAGVAINVEKTTKLISGQTKEYTCVANSLRMALHDFGIIKYEDTIAAALRTTESGAKILDIPKALENMYIEGFQFIARGVKTDKTVTFGTLENALKGANRKAIVSIRTEDIGSHAILVEKIENGRVFVRDPLPLNRGSYYSVSKTDFIKRFNKKFVILKK